MSKISVLRLGHRPFRDKRITTHAGLVSRAFGADGMIVAGRRDKSVEESMKKVVELWGGTFRVESGESWREVVRDWKSSGGKIVHLTMYGLPIDDIVRKLEGEDILLVAGAEKVPPEIFEVADFNVSVGSQPHSEVAALAIFLDRFFKGKELRREFKGAKLKILPSERGKKFEKTG